MPLLLYTLAVLGIVPEASYGDDYGHNPIGSGPYVLKQWDPGQQVIVVANPGYYGEAPGMERVIVVFMDEDAALAAVQKGAVDIAYTFATHADRTFDGSELTAFKTVDSRGSSLPCIPAGGTRVLEEDIAYRTGNDVTCDVAVRRAINLAINREQLIDNVLNGYGRPAFSVGDGMPWSSPDMRVECDIDAARALLDEAGWKPGADGILNGYGRPAFSVGDGMPWSSPDMRVECDIDAARALLDEAGWKPGADGIRERDGVRAAFDLWYSSDDSVRQATAHEVANQLAELGIEVKPQGGSWDEIYPHQFEQPVLWGWGSNAPVEVYELNYSTGWGNYSCRESAVTDAYLDQALAQTDVEASYGGHRCVPRPGARSN